MDGGKGREKKSSCGRDNDEILLEPHKKTGKGFQIASVNNIISGSSVAARPPQRSAVRLQQFDIVNELEPADHVDDEHGSLDEWNQVPGHSSVDNSSGGDSVMCPVSLNSLTTRKIRTPDTCDHIFCAACLEEWTKIKNTCPDDRQKLNFILVRDRPLGKIRKKIPVEHHRRVRYSVMKKINRCCNICMGLSFILCFLCELYLLIQYLWF
jgi:hypothetical protein